MRKSSFEISSEAKASIEREVTQGIDAVIAQLESSVADYDLQDDVAVETSHLEDEWIENLAAFDLDSIQEVVQSGFIKDAPIDFTPRTIALNIAALKLKRTRVLSGGR